MSTRVTAAFAALPAAAAALITAQTSMLLEAHRLHCTANASANNEHRRGRSAEDLGRATHCVCNVGHVRRAFGSGKDTDAQLDITVGFGNHHILRLARAQISPTTADLGIANLPLVGKRPTPTRRVCLPHERARLTELRRPVDLNSEAARRVLRARER